MTAKGWLCAACLSVEVFCFATRPNLANLLGALTVGGALAVITFPRSRPDLTRPEDRNKPEDTNL